MSSIPPRVAAERRFLARRSRLPANSRLVPAQGLAATKPLPQATGSSAWAAAGPIAINSQNFGLVTGRIASLALDPTDVTGNKLFVGTTGGGVWKSQNAGAGVGIQFVPLTDSIAALKGAPQAGISVGAISVQPGGTGVILAGLGDPNDALDSYYGAGLLRSADNGVTWTLIPQTMDLEGGEDVRDYSFIGEAFTGFAWSSSNAQLVVAAVGQAYEGTLVNAGQSGQSYQGLYYSTDGGATWHLARIEDPTGVDVQGPGDSFTGPDGNSATAVVWNPIRQLFMAAVRYHGYYQSTDGMTWTRLTAQPGTALAWAGGASGNCPTQPGNVGVVGCPIFRGALAVNPQTGDTFAWTVDANNQDQGIWQDACGLSGSSCTNPTIAFGTQLNTAALESSGLGGDAFIANGDYNLTLAAVPGGLGTGQDTLLFAGANDLWKCSLANSCAWRDTTNSTTCFSAKVGEYQHAIAWDTGNPFVMYLGNDSGLWRSLDQVGESGSVCASGDSGHFSNLNGSLGSLAEVESLAQSATTAATMLTGLGANGFAGIVNAPAIAGDWNQVLGGEGGTTAIDSTSNVNNWYANNAAGVSILHCNSATACTPAAFGTSPAVGETQVANDGFSMTYPAEFEVDPADSSQLIIGTCRVWRGPASGAGWSTSNAISPILDGIASSFCSGNALIRSIAALPVTGGGEVIYVGMAGVQDGGGTIAGHVYSSTLSAAGTAGTWNDLTQSPVTNSQLALNPFGVDISGIYIDPHDASGGTAYVTVAGFTSTSEQMQQVYATADGGQHWTSFKSNLPNAPANAIVVDPQDANTLYLASDLGVYVTRAATTCGSTACWAVYGTGLPLSPVTSLLATPTGASNAILTAGTYGRGIWQIPLASASATLTSATATPTALTFASRTVGTSSAAQSITLKNTGTAALSVSNLSFTGGAAPDFSETDTCTGVSIAKNSTCVVKVVFTPSVSGGRSATMVATANIAGGQLLVSLTGTGLSTGSVTLLPAALGFGTVQVGQPAATQIINVQNTGGTAITISSQTVTAPFTRAATSCGGTLAAGTACAVTIGFTPAQAGAATGSFTLVNSTGTQTATLSGTGITAPTDTLSTASLAFPATVVGLNSALVVQITNNGGLPLTTIGTSISAGTGSVPGDFTAVSNCGGQLSAGSSCGITVTFAPTVAKGEIASLIISDALHSQTVSLSGKGLAPPVITLSPKAIAFGSQQINLPSAAHAVTIQNTGGSPLGQPNFSLSGVGAASFQIGVSTCGSTVAAAASCTVQIVFQPVATGATTATLTVGTSSLGVASSTVALSGTGLSPPMLGVSPASLNFGPVGVGRSSGLFTVQITNIGQVAMTGATFTVTGANAADFALSAPTDIAPCSLSGTGTALAPGATCNVQLTFTPSIFGAESATLTAIGANAVPPTASVSLSGTGMPQIQLQASPVSLQFPATSIGLTTAAQVVTISNLGRQKANGLTLSFTGPYALVPAETTCATSLAGISSCNVGISFTPTVGGDQPGAMTATISNLGISPLMVPLDGAGISVGGITPSPTQMIFGSVVVLATSAPQTLTVTNTGQASLAGLQITASGDFSITANQCGSTLAAQVSCTAGVLFTPSTTGNRTGSLTISTTSNGVAPSVVGLTGQGILAGSMSAVPGVVSFGTVTVGQISPPQSVTLTNAGATTLTGLQYLVAGDYSLPQNGCATQLASGAQCILSVSFSPSLPGTRIGSVTVLSTTPGFIPFVVGLTGTGLPAAQFLITPSSLAFGSIPVGSISNALQLFLTNPGTGTLAGLFFQTNPPFTVGTGSCGGFLLPGGTCSVPVTFAPTIGGVQNSVIKVSSTSLGVAAAQVGVGGTGVLPASLSLSPSAISFGGVTVGVTGPAQTITVTNPGGVSLAGLKLQASGDFALVSTTCSASLAGGASCSAVVAFTPGVAGGRQGFLTASSTSKGVATVSSSLTGTGLTPAILSMTPSQLTFAAVLVGQLSAAQTVTVMNSGQSPIVDLAISVTSGFQPDSATTTCTAALAAGASCIAGVKFAPGIAGPITGSVTASSVLAAKGGTAPATASLTGTGALPPGIVTQPASVIQFQTLGIGQAAQPVTVTVTNAGTISTLTGLVVAIDANGASNGFTLSANSCGTSAAPGALGATASCTVSVDLKPTKAGPLTGSLLLTSANGGATASLSLAGIGFDFQFTAVGANSATVAQGQKATYTFAVIPLGGVTGGVFSLGCGTLPANALCVFNPPNLGPIRGTGEVALSISTSAPTAAAITLLNPPQSSRPGSPDWPRGILLVSVVVMLPLGLRRRSLTKTGVQRSDGKEKAVPCLWLLILLILAVSGATSCVHAGGSTSEVHVGGGTPTGTYSVPVTASSGGVSHSYSVTLIVN